MFAFDTEDDSKGSIYWINFFDGKEHYAFKTRADAINFLDNAKGKFWATNLEYDLCNIFSDSLSSVEWNFGRTKLIWARYKQCYFFDTLNHWQFSVETMGKFLGLPKGKFDPTNLKYCQRDTEITYYFTERMLKIYEETNADPKSTIASTALNHWLKCGSFNLEYKYEKKERLGSIPKPVIEQLRQSYYGGRTEAFFIGKQKGQIHYVDINSMYPFEMRGCFPDPYSYKSGAEISGYGVSCVKVFSDMETPVLPYRAKNGRLLFPNGHFTGCWANEELRYFIKCGGRILKTMGGYHFTRECEPFTNWVDDLYSRRKAARNEFEKITFKGLMNNLYGKFAQGNDRCYVMPYHKFLTEKRYKPDTWRVFGDMVIFDLEGEYPYQSNFIWSSIITAKARIYLHKLILEIKAKGNKVLYCDTDSVIFKGTLAGLKTGNELGQFKHEGEFKDIEIKTAKMYKYRTLTGDQVIKCKGVPSRAQESFFNQGSASYKKPLRLKESFRRNMRPNVWIDHTKVNIEEYSKGKVLKNGDIIPLIIKE